VSARIVCQHPYSNSPYGTEPYTQTHRTVADCEAAIARIETLDRARGGCEGPHTIEVWRDGGWVAIAIALEIDLRQVAEAVLARMPTMTEDELTQLRSDIGLVVGTGLIPDAVAWLRDDDTIDVWAGSELDENMDWLAEVPVTNPGAN
jgi:hypothetical protein